MEPRAAYEIASAATPVGYDRFYGPANDAAVGAGMILADVEYPTFISAEDRFGVIRGMALVLTHECDLDEANERAFNDSAIVCPIIPLEHMVEQLALVMGKEELASFLNAVTARLVNRLMYLPTVPGLLPLGGYLYLNLLTNAPASKLKSDAVRKMCMLSADGFRHLDYAMERHLRRPKADRVPFEPARG